jgi:PAS domain S-box-containing protein
MTTPRAALLLVLITAGLLLAADLAWRSANGAPAGEIVLIATGIALVAFAAVLSELRVFAVLRAARLTVAEPRPGDAGIETATRDLETLVPGLRVEIERHRALVAETNARLDTEATRRMRSERALRELEERHAFALERAGDGLWEYEVGTDAMQPSLRWCSMLGLVQDDAPDRLDAWLSRIHPDDRQAVADGLAAHLDGSSLRFESEHRMQHRDGRYRWLLSRATAIRHASGKAQRLVGLDTDITRFKRLQEVVMHVADGTANETGQPFFNALVMHFARSLGVRVAFITECVDHPTTRVRALAFWDRDRFSPDVEYDLSGTPCQDVVCLGETRYHPRELGRLFPVEAEAGLESYYGVPIFDGQGRILGHLAFLDERPMDEEIVLPSVYKIFAARAGAELVRRNLEGAILAVARETAQKRGVDCLRTLVQRFSTLVGTREAFVTQCVPGDRPRLRVLAWWRDGAFADGLEYDLEGTTCEETICTGRVIVYPEGVSDRFPPARALGRESYVGVPCLDSSGDVIGHIACMHDGPLRTSLPDDAVLLLFAERAAIEIERIGRDPTAVA